MSPEDLKYYAEKAANPQKGWFSGLPLRWKTAVVGAGLLGLGGTAVGIVFGVDALETASKKFDSFNPNKPVTTTNSAPESPIRAERSWLDDLQISLPW